jgi:elongation factor G
MSKRYPLNKVRNIGIAAHIDAGKTTTTERILFYTGKVHRMGEVHEGSTQMDWMDLEKERGITITSAATTCYWKDFQINIIDTPGHVDFTVEVERSLRVLDGAIALFCAVGGVEPQSETVWRQAEKYRIPRIAFVNKMDRIGADFYKVVDSIRDKLKSNPIPVQIPIGEGDLFTGLIDLVKMTGVVYNEKSLGSQWEEIPIPSDLRNKAEEYRNKIIEAVSEYDDNIMAKYLEGEEIKVEDLKAAIRKAVLDVKIIPVFCGSAFKNKGVQRLLDGILDYLPSPLDTEGVTAYDNKSKKQITIEPDDNKPFCALAFKVVSDIHVGKLVYFRVYSGKINSGSRVLNTREGKKERLGRILRMSANKREDLTEISTGDIASAVGLKYTKTGDTFCDEKHLYALESMKFPEPVIAVAIEPKTKADEDKLFESLGKLEEEDPTFKVKTNDETAQTIISGMGELHLEILVERLLREFKVKANVGKPQVSYKESISTDAIGEGKFIKQSGGRGHYGHVKLSVEPAKKGEKIIYENNIRGGNIPKDYFKAIEAGVKDGLSNGFIAGYPIVDIKVSVNDGSFHDVDSSDLAFRIAASMAVKNAVENASPILLEPIMSLEVIVPEEYLGNVVGDITSRRGKIMGIIPRVDAQIVAAEVPLSDVFGYATDLRSLSQGRAIYTMELAHFSNVPKEITEKVVSGYVFSY